MAKEHTYKVLIQPRSCVLSCKVKMTKKEYKNWDGNMILDMTSPDDFTDASYDHYGSDVLSVEIVEKKASND